MSYMYLQGIIMILLLYYDITMSLLLCWKCVNYLLKFQNVPMLHMLLKIDVYMYMYGITSLWNSCLFRHTCSIHGHLLERGNILKLLIIICTLYLAGLYSRTVPSKSSVWSSILKTQATSMLVRTREGSVT